MAGGSLTSDEKLILEECRLFYKNLYSKNVEVEPNAFQFFYQNSLIPNFPRANKNACDANITQGEPFKSLKILKSRVGLDNCWILHFLGLAELTDSFLGIAIVNNGQLEWRNWMRYRKIDSHRCVMYWSSELHRSVEL